MAKGLTRRQEMILDFVKKYIDDEGYPPSIREIGLEFKIGSLRGVTVHLDALVKKGYIERSNTPRSIKVVHPAYQTSSKVAMLPLLGQIAAGPMIFSEDHVEELIPVPSGLVRNIDKAFLLRVKGDSMSGDGILPRDLVIIRPQTNANSNDLVAAAVDDEATIKRIHFDGDKVRLMPSNPIYDPIIVDRNAVRIIGRVVGVLRDYEGMAF